MNDLNGAAGVQTHGPEAPQHVRSMMLAVGRLVLRGVDPRETAIPENLLMIVGARLDFEGCAWLAQQALRYERSIVHVAGDGSTDLPEFKFAFLSPARVEVYEKCYPFVENDGGPLLLIADTFNGRAVRFTRQGTPVRHRGPKSVEAAAGGIRRAYELLFEYDRSFASQDLDDFEPILRPAARRR